MELEEPWPLAWADQNRAHKQRLQVVAGLQPEHLKEKELEIPPSQRAAVGGLGAATLGLGLGAYEGARYMLGGNAGDGSSSDQAPDIRTLNNMQQGAPQQQISLASNASAQWERRKRQAKAAKASETGAILQRASAGSADPRSRACLTPLVGRTTNNTTRY